MITKKTQQIPSKDDVLYGFAVEFDRNQNQLKTYKQLYPMYAKELDRLYIELMKPEDPFYDDDGEFSEHDQF